MAFGRPPICILRVGDFYHTKIVIDTVNMTFDPLLWDLNPEGMGVQPMVAKIDLNFKFIGGSSLGGPILQLQNAVSFNFLANTSLYNPVTTFTDKINGQDRTFFYGAFGTPKQESEIINKVQEGEEEANLNAGAEERAIRNAEEQQRLLEFEAEQEQQKQEESDNWEVGAVYVRGPKWNPADQSMWWTDIAVTSNRDFGITLQSPTGNIRIIHEPIALTPVGDITDIPSWSEMKFEWIIADARFGDILENEIGYHKLIFTSISDIDGVLMEKTPSIVFEVVKEDLEDSPTVSPNVRTCGFTDVGGNIINNIITGLGGGNIVEDGCNGNWVINSELSYR